MLYLYFTRHGETEWNVENRLQGRLNSNLTANGVLHAGLLGKRLASTEFETVFSSPSARAEQTAKLIMGERHIPILTDERLMEIHLGKWQGKTMDEIKKFDSERYEWYCTRPAFYTNRDGESFLDVRERLEAFLQDIEKAYVSGNLLIVTHGVVIKVLQMICKNLPLEELWAPPFIDGTSLSIVKSEVGKRELLLEGDTSHKTEYVG